MRYTDRRLGERLPLNHVILFLFFQAEDGIRDLVRSRGLGDVYKRQEFRAFSEVGTDTSQEVGDGAFADPQARATYHVVAVSYTHLTLPTSDLV